MPETKTLKDYKDLDQFHIQEQGAKYKIEFDNGDVLYAATLDEAWGKMKKEMKPEARKIGERVYITAIG